MQEFYRYGFRIEIDDFGKEKSTLPMLKLPFVDTVKLDKSLIDCIGDRKGEIMLRQVVRLCYELGLYTTAEGVEAEDQVDFLRALDCTDIQATFSRRRFRSKNIPRSSGHRARNGLDIFARVGYNKRRFTDGFGRMIKCDDGNQRAKASSESRRCGASRWAEGAAFSSRSIVGESSNPRRLSPVTGFGFLAAEGCFLQLNQGGTALSGAPVHDCHACQGRFFRA